MDSAFKLDYRRLTGRSYHQLLAAFPGLDSVSPFLSGLMDSSYSVVLRNLLENLHGQNGPRVLNFESSERTLAFASEGFAQIVRESEHRFIELRQKWRERLSFEEMDAFLERNRWYAAVPRGFALSGKGMQRESKLLYLQTLHDMVMDVEKHISSAGGMLYRLQDQIVGRWHGEAVRDDFTKLLPGLEAALRDKEFAVFKRVRLELGEKAQELFTGRVKRWDKRVFPSKEALYRNAAWPWYRPGVNVSGFEGYMVLVASFGLSLSLHMISYYNRKWELYLRGLALGAQKADEHLHPALQIRGKET